MGKRKRTAPNTDLFYFDADELEGEKVVAYTTGFATNGRRVVRQSDTFYRPPSPTKAALPSHPLPASE